MTKYQDTPWPGQIDTKLTITIYLGKPTVNCLCFNMAGGKLLGIEVTLSKENTLESPKKQDKPPHSFPSHSHCYELKFLEVHVFIRTQRKNHGKSDLK